MGYRLDLDEMPEALLRQELRTRRTARHNGLCDYCGRTLDTVSCKFPERHKRFRAKDPLLLRFMKYLRQWNVKPGVMPEHEMNTVISKFRKTL